MSANDLGQRGFSLLEAVIALLIVSLDGMATSRVEVPGVLRGGND